MLHVVSDGFPCSCEPVFQGIGYGTGHHTAGKHSTVPCYPKNWYCLPGSESLFPFLLHADSFTLNESVDSDSIYTVVPAGNGAGMDVASVLLSDNYAHITECKYSSGGKTTIPTKRTVALSNGKAQTITATKLPLSGNVYTISTPGHLKWLQENCITTSADNGHFDGYTFKLINDIDMMLIPFTPIGGCDSNNSDGQTASKAFGGIFDGNGYTIHNLNIVTANNNVGLFGYLRFATVKNLTLSGGMVTGNSYVGGLAGFVSGSTIEDCYVDLVVYSPTGSKVGGVAGFTTGGTTVNRCANFGHVVGTLSNGIFGGIVGQGVGFKTNYITNCYNRGPVTAHGSSSSSLSGGIIGYTGSAAYHIANCYNAAPIVSCGTGRAIIGTNGSATTYSNLYYATGYHGATSGPVSDPVAYNQSAMKTQHFADTLGSSVFTYVPNLNDGYPIHWNDIHYGATSHTEYTGVVTNDASCTASGIMTYTCSCGHSYTEVIPATGHSYSPKVTAPTCTEDGYTTYTCSNCTHSYIGDTMAAAGHSYESVVTNATCTQAGSVVYTCSGCGDSYTESISALGHSFIDGACALCGEEDPSYVVQPTITVGAPSVSFEGEIRYNIYFTAENLDDVVEMGLAL